MATGMMEKKLVSDVEEMIDFHLAYYADDPYFNANQFADEMRVRVDHYLGYTEVWVVCPMFKEFLELIDLGVL